MNNLSQLGKAIKIYETGFGAYPSGGWPAKSSSESWVGSPDRKSGANQPGSWLYSILPYMDARELHDQAMSMGDATPDDYNAKRPKLIATVLQTPMSWANCPSRRVAATYAVDGNKKFVFSLGTFSGYDVGEKESAGTVDFQGDSPMVVRTDYAGCIGAISNNQWTTIENQSRPSTSQIRRSNGTAKPVLGPFDSNVTQEPNTRKNCNGVLFQCSEVKQSELIYGGSNTILLGEKSVNINSYTDGTDPNDSQCMYSGFSRDTLRSTGYDQGSGGNPNATGWPPVRDRAFTNTTSPDPVFGSAHWSTANFVFCDGSTRAISYSVDPLTFYNLGLARGRYHRRVEGAPPLAE